MITTRSVSMVIAILLRGAIAATRLFAQRRNRGKLHPTFCSASGSAPIDGADHAQGGPQKSLESGSELIRIYQGRL